VNAAGASVALAVLASLAAGCGGDAASTGAPRPSPTLSACERAWKADHDAGGPQAGTFAECLPSIRSCGSLGEWTRAARYWNSPIRGDEAIFVSNACAEADAPTKALEICVVADRVFRERG
jgi:hypothetical protein